LVVNHPGPAMRAARDGVGFWLTFRDQASEAIASGELISVLDDWCAPFPGPFLYYPSRRQPPPALAAFVAFVGEWRKRERKHSREK
jgi:DNA-binding transcriptional LysR family regulator